ncbi:MAG TPA: DUF2889 domain-containing protein [Candidatus Dormibacteraeota bacterium]|nr:DUF2889 domain-containing protein [Candidatus Dormibacteraeota bacterium]
MSETVSAWSGPKSPFTGAPPRRPGQLRRTLSMDMLRPDGLEGDLVLRGLGRDVLTGAGGEPVLLSSAELHVTATSDRTVFRATSTPQLTGLGELEGARLGPGFRALAARALGEEQEGTLLAQLVDDLPVTALISGFAHGRKQLLAGVPRPRASLLRIGTCAAWAPGSAPARRAVAGERALYPDVVSAAPPEAGPDPDAWHPMPPLPPLAMRRRRRIDVMPGTPAIVDAYFRDVVVEPDGSEAVLHEYTVRCEVDQESGVVSAMQATPYVLPYADCLGAVPSPALLDGVTLAELRATARQRLDGVVGCTHLMDAVRSMADVAHLLRY